MHSPHPHQFLPLQLVERFLAAKAKLDGEGPDASPNTLMDALHGVTSVRALLGASLSSGLRNDAPNNAMAMRQRWVVRLVCI